MKKPASAKKATPLKKESLTKNAKAKAALKKDTAKVNSSNLKKLGEMSLKDRVQAIAAEHRDEEAAAEALAGTMSAVEKSNAWNQHQVHLKKPGNESLKKDFESLGRKDKGLSSALFLLKKNKAVFGSVTKSASKTTELKRTEKWMSEKDALKKWSEQELSLHLQSGRVIWRDCPDKETKGRHQSNWQYGQEYELEDEDMEEWQASLEKDLQSLMLEGITKPCLEKGKGKGLEKGKGKGKIKGKPALLAITNGEETEEPEELTLEDALKKAKKTKALLLSTHSNFEEALKKVQKSPYLSKQSLKDKQAVQTSLAKMLEATKKLLEKGEKNTLEKVKAHLVEAVACMKEAKDEAKELVQIGNKALSKASKR